MRLLLLATLLLAVWASPSGARVDPGQEQFVAPWIDVYVAPVVKTDNPAPEPCPDHPIDETRRLSCPFDPTTDYYLFQGDDADAPVSMHCNYDAGETWSPCPHNYTDDASYYVRCDDGTVWSVQQSPQDVTPDNDLAAQTCGGPYTSLALPRP